MKNKYLYIAVMSTTIIFATVYCLIRFLSLSGEHLGLTAGTPFGPTITPDGGAFNKGIKVSMTPGAGATDIFYTTDGSTPSCGDSHHQYVDPFPLITDTTVQAIDCAFGGPSLVVTATFTFVSSGRGGGSTSIPSDLPNAPTCDTDPAVCPPNTPDAGGVTTPLVAPAFGTLLANDTQAFTRDLFLGTSGSDVVFLQSFLIRHNAGVKARALAAVGPTGTFGPLTQAAVIEFQIETGITPAQGYVGVKTRARINALAGILPSPLMTTTLLATPTPLVAPSKGGVGVGVPEYGSVSQ